MKDNQDLTSVLAGFKQKERDLLQMVDDNPDQVFYGPGRKLVEVVEHSKTRQKLQKKTICYQYNDTSKDLGLVKNYSEACEKIFEVNISFDKFSFCWL